MQELLREVYAAIDRQDYDRLGELISEDVVLHYIGIPEPLGRDALFELIREFYAAFPDYTHAVHEMVAEGNRVAVRLTFDATHRGEFEGIAPTGKRVSYAGMHIATIVDGVMEEWWGLEDNLGLMTQLGMQLTPAEPCWSLSLANKRLQLALQPFVQRPLVCGKVSSLQLVRSRFGLCSVDPRAPRGAAEAHIRSMRAIVKGRRRRR
jgi:steroid delta-isomerase-like uncharacterized protein